MLLSDTVSQNQVNSSITIQSPEQKEEQAAAQSNSDFLPARRLEELTLKGFKEPFSQESSESLVLELTLNGVQVSLFF